MTVTVGPRPFSDAMHDFARTVGGSDPVTVVGGRGAWTVGGSPDPSAREVTAPAGVIEFEPAEMTVRVGAGTTIRHLTDVLAPAGQKVVLPSCPDGTIGGALCVGWSDLRRLGEGPVREALLEASVVTSEGRLVRCGGPTVKNVTGYDLCRLAVGSLGTLFLLGEVVLRTRPLPAASEWVRGVCDDPWTLARPRLAASAAPLEPSAVLWDGTTVWVLLEGHEGDVTDAVDALGTRALHPCEGPPALPPHRWSIDPADLAATVAGSAEPFIAEVGVGTVHHTRPGFPRTAPAGVRSLSHRMKSLFDPTGRLNPGRDVLAP